MQGFEYSLVQLTPSVIPTVCLFTVAMAIKVMVMICVGQKMLNSGIETERSTTTILCQFNLTETTKDIQQNQWNIG